LGIFGLGLGIYGSFSATRSSGAKSIPRYATTFFLDGGRHLMGQELKTVPFGEYFASSVLRGNLSGSIYDSDLLK
jgi:hypothetical protein